MALLELLVVSIGGGIAKGALSIWLKDNTVLGEAGKSVTDAIIEKTKDVLAAREARRQFENIGDKVAANLEELIESRFVEMSLTEKEAVINKAGEALIGLELTPEFLLQSNFEPSQIEHSIFSKIDAPNSENLMTDLNLDQKRLFKLIISESAQYIVDIGCQLPSFTEKTLVEILKKENQILSSVDTILSEVKRIKEQALGKEIEAQQFESDYRRAVLRKLDELQLFGVDLDRTTKRYRLSIAYVSLSLAYSNGNKADDGELVSVNKALKKADRLLIRGSAGSGKTTLLQWIGVLCAGGNISGDLVDWNTHIPFLIKLREFTGKALPPLEDLPSLITSAKAGEMPSNWVHDRFKEQRVILLVDGIDELVIQERSNVETWLEDITSNYVNVKIIITSRPYAADPNWLEQLGFVSADLQEMSVRDVGAFIDHWHEAVKYGESDVIRKEELDLLNESLQVSIRRNSNLTRLATNPLLCAMICALHRDRINQLPAFRVELYEACIEMFLRRDHERNVPLSDYVDIPSPQKNNLLEDLAYWLIKNGWSEVETDDVDSRFNKKVQSLKDMPTEISGTGLRRYFTERSGILRQPSLQKIDFPHRTFQEYLAAKAIVYEEDYGVLLKNATNDQWREVIILTCGMAPRGRTEDTIDQLLRLGDQLEPIRGQLHLLAAACSDLAREVSDSLKQAVQKRIKNLVPPFDMDSAKKLSLAGELVLPYLKHRAIRTVKQLKPIIRTLALIGGDTALEILSRYSSDPRKSIQRELIESGKYVIDPERYGAFALTNIFEANIKGRFPLELLLHSKKLVNLKLEFDPRSFDKINVLENCENLESLYISHYEDVFSSGSTLSFIDFHNLVSLELKNSDFFSHLNVLRLGNIRFCSFDSCRFAEGEYFIEDPFNLENLNFNWCTIENGLHIPDNLDTLKAVRIRNSKLFNLDFISDQSNLSALVLNSCEFGDEENICLPHGLKKLTLIDSIDDLTKIRNVEKIESLTLSLEGLSNLTGMEKMISLEELEVIRYPTDQGSNSLIYERVSRFVSTENTHIRVKILPFSRIRSL